MPALQVRDFPQDLYDKLKVCSEDEHRSMSQQVIVAVEQMLTHKPSNNRSVASSNARFGFETDQQMKDRTGTRKRIFDKLDKMKIDLPDDLPDPTVLIREEREKRTEQICNTTMTSKKGCSQC